MITKVQEGLVAELAPSPWVCRHAAHIAAGGTVLDLACGQGRHARYLARQGFAVVAVDRRDDLPALFADEPGITPRVTDLEEAAWPFYGARFAGIVVTNYLHRPLWPLLLNSLAAGGILIYETFMLGNEQFGRPSRPEFLLRPQELLDAARSAGLRVLAYEEGTVQAPRPAVMQRICVQVELSSAAHRS